MLSSGRGDAGPILRSTSITMFVVDVEARIFDFDNHYYESEDALTRHQDKALGNRGVRWADIGGRRRLLVGGKINSYIANPTFDPVARPGSLYDWYRGNPRRQKITEAFGELEPIRPEYRDRAARLRVMAKQGVAELAPFPTPRPGHPHPGPTPPPPPPPPPPPRPPPPATTPATPPPATALP